MKQSDKLEYIRPELLQLCFGIEMVHGEDTGSIVNDNGDDDEGQGFEE